MSPEPASASNPSAIEPVRQVLKFDGRDGEHGTASPNRKNGILIGIVDSRCLVDHPRTG
jgi:hypothetical protein